MGRPTTRPHLFVWCPKASTCWPASPAYESVNNQTSGREPQKCEGVTASKPFSMMAGRQSRLLATILLPPCPTNENEVKVPQTPSTVYGRFSHLRTRKGLVDNDVLTRKLLLSLSCLGEDVVAKHLHFLGCSLHGKLFNCSHWPWWATRQGKTTKHAGKASETMKRRQNHQQLWHRTIFMQVHGQNWISTCARHLRDRKQPLNSTQTLPNPFSLSCRKVTQTVEFHRFDHNGTSIAHRRGCFTAANWRYQLFCCSEIDLRHPLFTLLSSFFFYCIFFFFWWQIKTLVCWIYPERNKNFWTELNWNWNIFLCSGTCKGCLSRTNCRNQLLRLIFSMNPEAILQPLKSEYYLNDTIRVSCREGFKLKAGAATLYSCETTKRADNYVFLAKDSNAPPLSICVRKFLTYWSSFVGLLFTCNTVLSGAEEREVDGPSLDRSYFSRLQPISFLIYNPSSSSRVG